MSSYFNLSTLGTHSADASLPDLLNVQTVGATSAAAQSRANAQQALLTLRRLLLGEKIPLAEAAWAPDIFGQMKSQNTIAVHKQEFFILKDYYPTGSTRHYSYSSVLNACAVNLKNACKDSGLKNVLVFGKRGRVIDPARTGQLFEKADFLLLPAKGDPYSLYRFLTYLTGHAASPESHQAPQVVVLENHDNLYTPLLTQIFGSPPDREPTNIYFERRLQEMTGSKAIRIKVSNSPSETVRQCVTAKKEIIAKVPSFNLATQTRTYPDEPIKVIFTATTSDKKIKELRLLYPEHKILSMAELAGMPPDATEEDGTYPGNAIGVPDLKKNTGKAYTILSFLRNAMLQDDDAETALDDNDSTALRMTSGKRAMLDKIRSLGLDPAKPLQIYLDDRGMDFPKELFKYYHNPAVEKFLDDPFRPVPGPELTHYFNAGMGTRQFLDDINKCYEAHEAARLANPDLPEIPRITTEYCLSVMLEFVAQTDEYRINHTLGSAECEFLKEPVYPDSFDQNGRIPPEIWFWLKAKSPELNPRNLTGAEMANEFGDDYFMTNLSAVSAANDAMRETMHIDRRTIKDDHKPAEGYQVRFVDGNVPGAAASAVFSEPQSTLSLRKTIQQISQPPENTLLAFNDWFRDQDAIVFKDDHGMPPAVLGYYFFSSVVAEQINPEDTDKLVMADTSSPELNYLSNLLSVGNEMAYTKENPATLLTTFNHPQQMTEALSQHQNIYNRSQLGNTGTDPATDALQDIHAKLDNPRQGAFVCCSAGSIKDPDKKSVQHTVEALCSKGYDIYYGGGDQKMMGEVYNAVKDWNARCADQAIIYPRADMRVNIIGISTQNIAKRETANGTLPEVDYAMLTDTIHGRMANLIGNMSTQIILNGGAGTVQEIFAFAMLKESQNKLVKDKQMTILNTAMTENGPKLYDNLLLFFGKGDLKQGEVALKNLGINIVSSDAGMVESINSASLLGSGERKRKSRSIPEQLRHNQKAGQSSQQTEPA